MVNMASSFESGVLMMKIISCPHPSVPMPSGTTSTGSGGQGSSGGAAASERGLLAAPNEVIKTIRGSTNDLAWPAATAMFTATADTLPDKHAVNESKVPTTVPEGPYLRRKKRGDVCAR